MSADARVAAQLVKTLENGSEGFTSAAEKLNHRSDVASTFNSLARERATLADELRSIAAAYDDPMPDHGSVAGAVHRGWMALKDVVTGGSDDAVINAARTGEAHAVEQYEDAINDADVSPEFKGVLGRQLASVKSAAQYVDSLA